MLLSSGSPWHLAVDTFSAPQSCFGSLLTPGLWLGFKSSLVPLSVGTAPASLQLLVFSMSLSLPGEPHLPSPDTQAQNDSFTFFLQHPPSHSLPVPFFFCEMPVVFIPSPPVPPSQPKASGSFYLAFLGNSSLFLITHILGQVGSLNVT